MKDKKNVHAAIEAGEIEKYSLQSFRLSGKKGGIKGGPLRWKGKTKEEIARHMKAMSKKAVEARRKLSTDKTLQPKPPVVD